MEKNISWAYYGGAYNDAVALSNEAVAANPTNPNLTAAAVADPAHALGVAYCQICNPFQYATSIMANPTIRTAHVKDTADLITAIQNNTLPAVSFGKPDGLLDGHPSELEGRPVRSLHAQRSQCARCQSEAEGGNRRVRHLGRGWRLLGLGLRPVDRLLRRRTAYPAA